MSPARAVPLDRIVSAIVDARTGELQLTSQLAHGATLLLGVAAAELLGAPRAALAGDVHAALPCNVSVRLCLRREHESPHGESAVLSGGEPAPRIADAIGLVLRRGDGALAFELDATLELAHEGKREIVALEPRTIVAPDRVVFVLPSPWKTAPSLPWVAVAVEIERSPPPARATEQLVASLAAERALTPTATPPPAPTTPEAIDLNVL